MLRITEGDETEDGQLAEHGLQDGLIDGRRVVFDLVLRQLENYRHADQHRTDANCDLNVKVWVNMVAREEAAVMRLLLRVAAMSGLLAMAAMAVRRSSLSLQVETIGRNACKQHRQPEEIFDVLTHLLG